jgi:DNA-directed RNA polymerase
MKTNKKINLSEAAAQVMGVVPMDGTGKSDSDGMRGGSMTASPIVSGVPATTPVPPPIVPSSMAKSMGSMKVAPAPVASKPEEETEEEEEETEEEEMEESTTPDETKEEIAEAFRSAISSLLGESVDESAFTQIEAIFEAAVQDRVQREVATTVAQLDEGAKEYLETVTNRLVEKVDDYLDYVVEEWMKENAIAVEQGIKTTIAENFITGLKELFENHYIDVPAEKYNVLDDLYAQNRELQEKLNATINESIQLKKDVALTECAGIFVAETRDLADTQVAKLQSLMENINFTSPEEYREKLVAIKNNYVNGKRPAPTQTITEEQTFSKSVNTPGTLVESYANVIGRLNKKL